MAAQNIAIVFGPTLIDSPSGSASYETIMTHNNIARKDCLLLPINTAVDA